MIIDSLPPLQSEIIKVLWRDKQYQRKDFVKLFSTARTTIFDNLRKLEIEHIVYKKEVSNGKQGRPIILWGLTRSFIYDMENRIQD